MMDIVVIGTTEFLPGFALAGVKNTILTNKKDVLGHVAQNKDAIVLLDEALVSHLGRTERQELETSIDPVVIILGKHPDAPTAELRRSIVATLGVDLLPDKIKE